MNIYDLYVDSPNGYEVTAHAPKETDLAVKYYLAQIELYEREEYPTEFAIANYALGKVLFADKTKPLESEDRAKRIENALYHFHASLEIFDLKNYPVMYAVISIFVARLFRERALLVCNRSFLSKRSTSEESVQYGVDQVLEAFPVYFLSKPHAMEHALCCLEAGWLYVVQAEFLEYARDESVRENAVTYLERAISLSHTVMNDGGFVKGKGKNIADSKTLAMPGKSATADLHAHGTFAGWNPKDKESFPDHVKILLDGFPFQALEGTALYLLGRLYSGWPGDIGMVRLSAEEAQTRELDHQTKGFQYFGRCVRPKFLTGNNPLWADAHHRAATMIIRTPQIIDPDFISFNAPAQTVEEQVQRRQTMLQNSDLYLESAITHLAQALRCPVLSKSVIGDIHFHSAQAQIARLQLLLDRIPPGKSVTQALQQMSSGASSETGNGTDGLDIVRRIEEHLRQALSRVTAASTQSTQDGYLYYFACLKLAEYRMLESASDPRFSSQQRSACLFDSVGHLVSALCARTLKDNMDLHYIVSSQMAQMLLATRKFFAAAKCNSKVLFSLSTMINRSLFNSEAVQNRFYDETSMQGSLAMTCILREVDWCKKHVGPLRLQERAAAGYGHWNFERADSSTVPKVPLKASVTAVSAGPPVVDTNYSRKQPPMPVNLAPLLDDDGDGGKGKRKKKKKAEDGSDGEDDNDDDDDDDDNSQNSAGSAMMANVSLAGGGESLGTSIGSRPHHVSMPPKSVPPLNLSPPSRNKRVITTGADKVISPDKGGGGGDDSSSVGGDTKGGSRRPHGAVPLYAMGHNPDFDELDEEAELEGPMDFYYSRGPYCRRLRQRMPPIGIMKEIDAFNKKRFAAAVAAAGGNAGAKVNLLPGIASSSALSYAGSTVAGGKDVNGGGSGGVPKEIPTASAAQRAAARRAAKMAEEVTKAGDGDDESSGADSDEDEDENSEEEESSSEEEETEDERKRRLRRERAQKQGAVAAHHQYGTQEFEPESVLTYLLSSFKRKKKESKEMDKSIRYAAANPPRPEDPNEKKGFFRSLFGGGRQKTDPDPLMSDTLGLWCSPFCYQALMIMSRCSRMQLMLRASQMQVLDGERTNSLLFQMYRRRGDDRTVVRRILQLKAGLYGLCANLIVPPLTLKDLGTRSFAELQILFRSHAKIARLLQDFEEFVYEHAQNRTGDIFLPLIMAAPCLGSRGEALETLDDTLLNANSVLGNLVYEEEAEKLSMFPSGGSNNNDAASSVGGHSSTVGERRYGAGGPLRYDSVSSAAKTSSGDGGTAVSTSKGGTKVRASSVSSAVAAAARGRPQRVGGAPAHLSDVQAEQWAEERDSSLSGRMTLSMSSALDGSANPHGIRDMLLRNLAIDECLLLFHLPPQGGPGGKAGQMMQVVLVYRDNSETLYPQYTSAAAPVKSSKEEEKSRKQADREAKRKARQEARAKRWGGGKSFDKLKAKEAKEAAAAAAKEKAYKRSLRKGVVMELARSEVTTPHVEHLVQSYITALHTSPQPNREIYVADALRALSCALSLTELLHIIPPHVSSLVVCCPPLMRLIPWHLLLVEVPKEEAFAQPAAEEESFTGTADGKSKTKPSHAAAPEPSAKTAGGPVSQYTFTGDASALVDDEPVDAEAAMAEAQAASETKKKNKAKAAAAAAPPPAAEKPKKPKVKQNPLERKMEEKHLLELFNVRIGSNLNLFELNAHNAALFRQSVGLHRMCAVDGESSAASSGAAASGGLKRKAGQTQKDPNSAMHVRSERSAGVRGTDIEVACVTSVFSADPDDMHILVGSSAAPHAMQTGLFQGDHEDHMDYLEFKRSIFMKRAERLNAIKLPPAAAASKKKKAAELAAKEQAETLKRVPKPGSGAVMKDDDEEDGESLVPKLTSANLAKIEAEKAAKEAAEEEKKTAPISAAKEARQKAREEKKEEQAKARKALERQIIQFNMKSLTMCRVLHIAAFKTDVEEMDSDRRKEKADQQHLNTHHYRSTAFLLNPEEQEYREEASIKLPKYEYVDEEDEEQQRKAEASHGHEVGADEMVPQHIKLRRDRDRLTASDIVQQLHISNCALCVLSRFGLTDDVKSVKRNNGVEVESSTCFIEACHLAGATSVIYPIWGGVAKGLSTLANLVLLVRFYAMLPGKSRHRLSIVETLRKAQLWLRDSSADDVIAFLLKAPIPSSARATIIEEMESYVTASLPPSQLKVQREQERARKKKAETGQEEGHEHKEGSGNRIGGNRKFFTHPLYWGGFAVSGHGGGVHHPELTEDHESDGFGTHIPWDDAELNNMQFEAQVLRMEGKIEEATILEARIKALLKERALAKMVALQAAGMRVGRGVMDGLDRIDKAFLDQESDSIESVSSDSSEWDSDDQSDDYYDNDDDFDEYEVDDEYEEDDERLLPPANETAAARRRRLRRKKKKRRRKKFEPVPLDLAGMKAEDVAYEKWKKKIGTVEEADTAVDKLVKKAIAASAAASARKPDPKKADNYEYLMMQSAKATEEHGGHLGAINSVSPSADDSIDEFTSAGSKTAAMVGNNKASKNSNALNRLKQLEDEDLEAEQAALEEDEYHSSDDDEYASHSSDDTVTRNRKRAIRRQERIKRHMKNIRGGVRSYLEAAKVAEQMLGKLSGTATQKAQQAAARAAKAARKAKEKAAARAKKMKAVKPVSSGGADGKYVEGAGGAPGGDDDDYEANESPRIELHSKQQNNRKKAANDADDSSDDSELNSPMNIREKGYGGGGFRQEKESCVIN